MELDRIWSLVGEYVWPLLAGFAMLVILFAVIAMIDRHPRGDDKRPSRRSRH